MSACVQPWTSVQVAMLYMDPSVVQHRLYVCSLQSSVAIKWVNILQSIYSYVMLHRDHNACGRNTIWLLPPPWLSCRRLRTPCAGRAGHAVENLMCKLAQHCTCFRDVTAHRAICSIQSVLGWLSDGNFITVPKQ